MLKKDIVSSLSIVPSMIYNTVSLQRGKRGIEVLQQQRFHRLLMYVYNHSPFYRQFYESHGIRREHLKELRVEDVPIIDKK
ncbi:MAG: hypothetical protein JW795_07820, partial [Chitinivibrionales bacterium]|nr:hypothetical protein [Chitinivibrionales bacterium]